MVALMISEDVRDQIIRVRRRKSYTVVSQEAMPADVHK
jgi:hypothetical protein